MNKIGITFLAIILTGCATSPDDIEGRPTDPKVFTRAWCKQLQSDAQQIAREIVPIYDRLDSNATKDSALTLLGLATSVVLTAPFLEGDNDALIERYSQLKGEYETIYKLGKQIDCPITEFEDIVEE